MGYFRAGFEVTGVDIKPQKNYPFEFHCMDGIEYLLKYGSQYDLISVSPPCQGYSKSTQQWRKEGREYPDMIGKFRDALTEVRKPYVIENVPNAPLVNPIFLNGAMFGLFVHRPRYFECSFPVIQPAMPFVQRPIKMGRPVAEGEYIQPVGHFSGVPYARKQMEIDWMNVGELAEAIPPAYTKYIGEQFLAYRDGTVLVSLPTGTFARV